MNNSGKLCFREWQKPEQVLALVSWRPREGLVFVLRPNGEPTVLQLAGLAIPQQQGPGSPAGRAGKDGPATPSARMEPSEAKAAFPDAMPVILTEIRLMPPPCRADEAEAESLRQQARGDAEVQPACGHSLLTPAWELARLRYDAEVLVPTPADNQRFAESLKQFLCDRQQEYEARKAELAELKALVDHRLPIIHRTRYYSDLCSSDVGQLACLLDREQKRLEWSFCQDCLRWPIAEARRHTSIRNPILRARWAKACNLNMEDMAAQRRHILNTLPPHTVGQDVLGLLGNRPGSLSSLLGYPQRYDPLQDLTEPAAAFGDATWEQLALCAQIRFHIAFEDQSTTWLSRVLRRAPQNQGERQEFIGAGDLALAQARIGANTLRTERQRIEAATRQLAAKTAALEGVIAPLNRLYPEIELAEIRKRAIGHAVPDLFVDWVMARFQESNPPRLPTKGDAYNNCGPGTLIGKKLAAAGKGVSRPRLADHLTVIRRLLEQKGWLAAPDSGTSRKRESNFQPDDRLEDFNQPTPAESAEDRDEERQKASSSDAENNKGKEPDGHSSETPDAD